MFYHVREKALRQILRIMDGMTAAAHKTVKRRPIDLAKLGKRGVRKLRFGLASPRRQNNAPVSRRKQIALTTPVPCQRLHVSGLYQDCSKKASRRNFLRIRAAPAPESLCKGKATVIPKPHIERNNH